MVKIKHVWAFGEVVDWLYIFRECFICSKNPSEMNPVIYHYITYSHVSASTLLRSRSRTVMRRHKGPGMFTCVIRMYLLLFTKPYLSLIQNLCSLRLTGSTRIGLKCWDWFTTAVSVLAAKYGSYVGFRLAHSWGSDFQSQLQPIREVCAWRPAAPRFFRPMGQS